jgi:uncharacterized protein (DUF488 family)
VPQRQVYTIGYEGADLASFLAKLASAGIKQVIDVRELPLSRKRGFSKTALAAALAEREIRYLHLRDLGDPKPGREAARRGDHSSFLRIYRRHLAGTSAQAALAEANRQAAALRSCLLCFERDHDGCHRSIVADAMTAATGIRVTHLRVYPPDRHSAQSSDERATTHVW